MNAFFTSALALIVTLGLLIAFHEFGHYWTARRLGVKVLRFCIGFGKPLWSRRYGPDQTEYAIAAFPLGGYVKMLDEREEEVAEAERHRAFNTQPVMSRFAIVAAGPLFNFVFAILAFWLMYLVGVPGVKAVIGEVTPASAAASAGLLAGDELLAVGGEQTPTWSAARLALLDRALDAEHVTLAVRGKDGVRRTLTLSVAAATPEIKQGDLLGFLGITPVRPAMPAVLGELQPGGAAQKAGLQSGDHILRADGEDIADWAALVRFVRAHPLQTVQLELERDGSVRTLGITIGQHKTDTGVIGRIGAAPAPPGPMPPELKAEVRYGPLAALGAALNKSWQLTELTLRMIGKMLVGQVSVENLSGPITIATYAGYSASVGMSAFLYFLAVVSISLGVLNLLPIPILDGGHLMYYLIEMVKGSPLSDAVQMKMQRVGIAFLVMLMALAFYNDLNRLFGG
jgi:regulator of sigma E protease